MTKKELLHEWIDQLDEDSINKLYIEFISNVEPEGEFDEKEKKEINNTYDSLYKSER